MVQKFLPSGPKSSKMSYEVYKNKDSSDTDFNLINDMYARVMSEDKVLCNNAQRNLDRGVFVNGQLHPKYEKAPLFFQSSVRDAITEHYEREKSEGRELWPAQQKLPGDAEVSQQDEMICADLACRAQKEVLAW